MSRARWLLGACALLGATPAHADLLHLVSGTTQECVILRVTDAWVRYETALGVVSLPRYKIASMTREPVETNRRLQKGWQADRAAAEARARARQRKAKVDQLTKQALGLVEYDGEWVTPEERSAREQAKEAAREAAAALNRAEMEAGHRFYYGVWMTPAAYEAVRQEEKELGAHHERVVALQKDVTLLDDQIATIRMMVLSTGDLEMMEDRAAQIEKLKAEQDDISTSLRDLRRAGDLVVDRIERLIERARGRLRDMLVADGASPAALEYLAEPS